MKKLICTLVACFALIVAVDYAFADFTPEPSKVPTSIGDISIVITDLETGTDTVTFGVQVRDANGDILKHKTGNLVPHMTAGQITAMQAFAAAIRTKAQAFIPAP